MQGERNRGLVGLTQRLLIPGDQNESRDVVGEILDACLQDLEPNSSAARVDAIAAVSVRLPSRISRALPAVS